MLFSQIDIVEELGIGTKTTFRYIFCIFARRITQKETLYETVKEDSFFGL